MHEKQSVHYSVYNMSYMQVNFHFSELGYLDAATLAVFPLGLVMVFSRFSHPARAACFSLA